jgi:hypothetical protein
MAGLIFAAVSLLLAGVVTGFEYHQEWGALGWVAPAVLSIGCFVYSCFVSARTYHDEHNNVTAAIWSFCAFLTLVLGFTFAFLVFVD